MPPRCLIPPPPGVWPRVPCAPPPNAAPANVPFVLRPAARSVLGVQNLPRRALHAAVRAEHTAVVRPGAQHLVATPALISQKCRYGGHHLFPLGSAYRAGQDRNLDGSASHRAVNPGRKIVSGAQLNPLSWCGVNHALHQADDSVAAAASLRRLSGGRVSCPALQLGPGMFAPRTRNFTQRRFATEKCSEL